MGQTNDTGFFDAPMLTEHGFDLGAFLSDLRDLRPNDLVVIFARSEAVKKVEKLFAVKLEFF